LISCLSVLSFASSVPKVLYSHLNPSGVLAAQNWRTLPALSRPSIFGKALSAIAGLTTSISSTSTWLRFKPIILLQFSKDLHSSLLSPSLKCKVYSGSGLALKVYGISYCSRNNSKSVCHMSLINGAVGSITAPINPIFIAANFTAILHKALVLPAPYPAESPTISF